MEQIADADVLGWYGKANIGDEAFRDVFSTIFDACRPGTRLNYLETLVPPLPKALILGGGDVVRPFYLDQIPAGCVVYPLGVGLGYASELDLLRRFDIPLALFRNKADVILAQEAGIAARYCPDLTFSLDPAEPRTSFPGARKRLGVLLSAEIMPTWQNPDPGFGHYVEYLKWELATALDYLAKYYDIFFLSFSLLNTIDDRIVHGDVLRRMHRQDSVLLVNDLADVPTARSWIASMDCVISMKFHGVMFAVQSGVPVVNIAETRKTQLFCAEAGLEDCSMPPRAFSAERLLTYMKRIEAPETQARLWNIGAALRDECRLVLRASIGEIARDARLYTR